MLKHTIMLETVTAVPLQQTMDDNQHSGTCHVWDPRPLHYFLALRQVADSKGNSVAYPKAVLGLPFSDQGNSYFFSNDYEMQCKTANQGTTGGGKVSIHCPGMSLVRCIHWHSCSKH